MSERDVSGRAFFRRSVSRRSVSRRTVLAGVSTGIVGTLAGCLGDDRPDGVVLDPPENWEQIRDAELANPMYGDQVPEATVPAPLQDRDVTTTEFVGERHAMFTFVFTRCPSTCPMLTSALATVQADALENGYADEFAFYPTTFDPEYDTSDVIEEYSENRGADPDAENWRFLRPVDDSHANEVVDDTFGVAVDRVDEIDHGGDDGHDHDDDHNHGDDHDHDHGDDHEGHEKEFLHTNLVLLVNADGYVERSYTPQPPNLSDVLEDATTLRERW